MRHVLQDELDGMLALSEYADHPESATDMLVKNCGGKPPNDVLKFHVGT